MYSACSHNVPRAAVIRTWKKLSPHGKAAAGTIPLEEGLKKMVGEAVGEIDKQTASQGAAKE